MAFSQTEQNDLIRVAHHLADLARPIALQYFRTNSLGLENKLADGFDPVTQADKEIEAAMREALADMRPDDGIDGEEFPNVASKSGLTWVLDPIDGTRGFVSGTPTWGVLIAINAGAAPVFGIVEQPYIEERFAGGFGVSEVTKARDTRQTRTRVCADLSEATLFTTFPEVGTLQERAAFERVRDRVKMTRYGMDCYAYALVAAGQVDLVIEAGLNTYDIQGPMAVVEAAGGVVTNWQGGPAEQGGQVIAASDIRVHKQALELLNQF